MRKTTRDRVIKITIIFVVICFLATLLPIMFM
ncbi:DUF4044 domain-containing protein [Clostridium perfringens]|uniref:DUF4044 domain-containing protein n=1 Tax=Clostridium perfringens TaxID=1502 RepID=A0A317TPS0_CLOPF|nr:MULTISPECIES: DUF4044 domain-containing protein [Clostridium]MDK7588734.1 DUF4044 domain-containing protein [Clostridium sp. UMB9555B]DAP32314.1 MAG TPA: hypothetical protein [Caudoviricetes sp.]AWS26526.1 DUF4044 domain-containing protein [Clostridium perfringens]AXH52926.1 DUF4044 domain-containing protein [Clostridium perfringens]EGS5727124.1 DUF4044 domain-containing protein [Clostridium perfringens]